jgi:hypothetical protein
MAVLHPHQGYVNHRSQAYQLRYLAVQGRWGEPNSLGLATGLVMTGIGLALLVGYVGAEFANDTLTGLLLLFFGSPFLVFGGMLLLVIVVESTWRRLRRIQNHCGRCRFYQALNEEYTLGHCRADPREAVVHRTGNCTFFDYSERAMVRDRFAQRAETIARSRNTL